MAALRNKRKINREWLYGTLSQGEYRIKKMFVQ